MPIHSFRGVTPQLGQGVFVSPGRRIPAGQLALGALARIAREPSPEERREIRQISRRCVHSKNRYAEELGPGGGSVGIGA